MDSVLIIAIAVLLVLNVALAFLIFSRTRRKDEGGESKGFELLLQQMNELSRVVDRKVGESSQMMRDSLVTQLSESQKLIREINRDVNEQLSEVAKGIAATHESNKQVLTITEQLQNLEKVLKHQKQRGNLGEASLELILGNILPPTAYKMQYQFSDGDKVDAIIQTKEGFIPVDAKFSLDNYNRITNEKDEIRRADLEKEFKNDLKKRIDETAKYVRTNEGTLPFAFMFIPAEGIYYDLLVNEVGAVKVNTRNLIDYAYNDKKVIIVSPTTFAAYLQSVLYGFKAFTIEKKAQLIAKNVEELTKHLKAFEEYHRKVGNALGTVVNHYTASYKEFNKIDKDIVKITGESMAIEAPVLTKPEIEA